MRKFGLGSAVVLALVSAAGGADVLELALPRNEMCGLKLQAGEEIGMALYIGIPDKGAISLFEPWSIFDSLLKE